jgi:hypothetical protein
MKCEVTIQSEIVVCVNGGGVLRAGWKFALVAFFIVLPAFGSSVFSSPGGLSPGSGAPVNLGMVFTANSTLFVDALGFYKMDGIGDATLAIYDGSGDLLTSAEVTLSDPLVNGYFQRSISPITLISGSQYTVTEFSSNGIWSFGGEPITTPEITYNYHDYLYASALAFPTISGDAAGGGYYGPNFWIADATATPEPGTVILLMPGLLVFLGVAARRRCVLNRQS